MKRYILRTPLIRVAFYGQNKEGEWFRHDKLVTPNTPKEAVDKEAEKLKEKNKLEWISYGIDSRIYVQKRMTGEVEELGAVLFIDIDIRDIDAGQWYEIMSVILDIGVVPDIAITKNGMHLRFWFIDEPKRQIERMEKFRPLIDEKALKVAKSLNAAVLRLSEKKKNEINDIILINEGKPKNHEDDLYLVMGFVRKFEQVVC